MLKAASESSKDKWLFYAKCPKHDCSVQNHRKVHLEVITIQEKNDSGLNECGYRKMNFKIIFTILGKNGKWTGCRIKEVDVGLRV